MSPLEQKFEAAMFDIYRRAKSEAKYTATIFLSMLNDRGGLATAKTLVNAEAQSQGYTALMFANRLDLTVEALVVEDRRWHSLFLPEEISKAKKRLQDNQYVVKMRN
ncbi:hypothetical protein ADU59_26095 [Pararhizobium polonicum]|uniref:Uncharacterized protein n=1 Tax=Pararhizobium polonicum TaxID=1612624 RepID=A0A1C7NU37_9HYPH|nr:hypothetical protein [Pararhizobium polonicum]OBZ92527.1 hypothetical protein ADU59_26095 [Pararhizobium polonicum]